jgi:hypothetical protein
MEFSFSFLGILDGTSSVSGQWHIWAMDARLGKLDLGTRLR